MDTPASLAMADRMNGLFSALEISPEQFKEAYDLPIGDHVEKNYKGLSYLSWPFAFCYLKQKFPTFFVAFEEASIGWPVFGMSGCWLLRPYLTDGVKRTPALVFPLMDNKHNSLQELNARSVSDNMQRASVKCIATFTGLGLKLYAGEDIPRTEEGSTPASPRLPLQQDAPIQKKPDPAIEGSFDGKNALLTLCKTNPFGFADERASLMAGKNALENLGLAKGDDIKDSAMFANVVTTMVASWTKANGLKITKAAMQESVDKIRAICTEGNVDDAIKAVEVFVAGKQ